jgi:hypothetical protein
VDNRPHHPLIRHAKVTQLLPKRLSSLDLTSDPGDLREALAECADGWDRGVASSLPRQAIRG